MSKKKFDKNLMHPTRKKMLDYVYRGEQYSPVLGYEKETVERKVGDVWEDEYHIYEKKKGYIVKTGKNHSVYKDVRDFIETKSQCKNASCKKQKYGYNDKLMIVQTGLCIDCIVKIESDIKRSNLWESYECWRMFTKALGIANDTIDKIEQGIKDLKPYYEFILENGTIERWDLPKSVDEMRKDMELEISRIKSEMAELQEDIIKYRNDLYSLDQSILDILFSHGNK